MPDDREAVLERTREGNRTCGQRGNGEEQVVLGFEGHWAGTGVYSE